MIFGISGKSVSLTDNKSKVKFMQKLCSFSFDKFIAAHFSPLKKKNFSSSPKIDFQERAELRTFLMSLFIYAAHKNK